MNRINLTKVLYRAVFCSLASSVLISVLNSDACLAQDEKPQDTKPREISEDVKVVLQQLHRGGLTQEQRNTLLSSVADSFPLVPAYTGEQPSRWRTTLLNTSGAGFDAVRFKSTLDSDADMCWAFLMEGNGASWYIASADGKPMAGFRKFWKTENVRLNGLDLPERNKFFMQRLLGGHIKPGHEFILHFNFYTSKPAKVHTLVRLFPASERESGKRLFVERRKNMAEHLQLQWPISYTTVGFGFVPTDREEIRE